MSGSNGSTVSVNSAAFGKTTDGTAVDIYTLKNKNGMEARVTNYGGILVGLTAPDRNGTFFDVVLGHDGLDGYLHSSPYFGAIVGRYANRIAGAKFSINGDTYPLAANNGTNSLHGGIKGFDKVIWQAKSTRHGSLELTYLSRSGEEGFPGNLKVKAVYSLTGQNELRMDFTATTDAPTICNLTNHSYFNLSGGSDVLAHEIFINANRFTPVDDALIPTGELKPVEGTPFDFRKPMSIGARIHANDAQLKLGKGYDQNFVIDKPEAQLGLHARAYDPASGRILEVLSTEPGMQFYTANYLDGTIVGKGATRYLRFGAFCIEPQHFPDSPNKPAFPSVLLRPGEVYRNTIVYKFTTQPN